ncbi:MAG: hypothetical protein HY744_23960, partial [Deltaproteobacteria bacterium]|nr:hypothetical protein [Deltaproteobacteria bacterium]
DLVAGLRRSHCPVAPCSWEPVPPPEIIPDLKHLRRLVRYLALNPCRAGLASDPLSWPWSTHRDVVGAVADPWIDGSRLAAALVLPAQGFAVAHHAYVSGDPCVSTAGTPFSRRAAPTPVAVQPLAALAAAAAAANRAAPADIKRRSPTRALLLELAGRHGWQDGPRLAALCEVGRWTVWRGLHQRDEAALAAAELCLGDERLRIWRTPQRRSPVESHKTCDSGAERWAIAPRITHFV